ncbi:hypothetical protein EC973_007843 [Apophysomyces ossiformis]|uniref:Uncharacterized protein n=1 Tax=Apophysomyces ossiformis TaxID=679940 RepID=A0A8H7BTD2_9FUNG|nr:hypothetical protein EC973_007843 [Apophysomyces ossiformis]
MEKSIHEQDVHDQEDGNDLIQEEISKWEAIDQEQRKEAEDVDEDDETTLAGKKRKYRHTVLERYEFTTGACPQDPYLLPSGAKLYEKWHIYKAHAVDRMKRSGLYLAADLYEVLYVILDFTGTLKAKYMCEDTYISDELQLCVTKVLRKLAAQNKNISRRTFELELLVLSKDFEEDECVLIDIIRCCIQKLPFTDSVHEIGEMELITTYLDPVLATMLNRPEKNKYFRWLNQQVIEYGAESTNLRPDATMSLDPTKQETYAAGYCEVKPSAAKKRYQDTHLDTLRTALFCKDALDRGEIRCTLGIQTVGTHVDIYLCTLESEALYPENFDVPTSLSKLPKFITDLDKCKRILKVYDQHCVKQSGTDIERMKRPSVPIEQLFKVLNTIIPPNFKPTLDFN